MGAWVAFPSVTSSPYGGNPRDKADSDLGAENPLSEIRGPVSNPHPRDPLGLAVSMFGFPF